MAQKILGLDLGTHAVKAVVVEAAYKGHVVTTALEVPLPPPSVEEGAPSPLAAAVRELLARLGPEGKTDACAVALPGTGVAMPIVALPFSDPKKIEATLGFEIEGLVPVDLDELLFDHQLLSQRDGKSELLVGVARREEVRALIAELLASGVDPRVITLPGLAHAAAAAIPAHRPGPEEAVALLDVGHERTTVTVLVGGPAPDRPELGFTRTFSAGGADLTRALARELGLPREEAETVKRERGSLADDADPALRAALVRGLAPVLREVRQSLRAAFARTRRQASRAILSGGTARLPGLAEHLARELGLPVELAAPLGADAAGKVPEGDHPVYAEALGLALRAQSRGGKALNLRKGEFAYRGDLDYLKGKVSRLVAFAAVLVVLLGANLWAHLRTLETADEGLTEALCEVTQQAIGKCESDFNVALSKLQGGDTKASQIPTASAVEILAETTNRMPPEVDVALQEVEVSLQKVRLRGIVDSFDGVDQVVAGLKKSSCFGEVKRGNVKRTKDDKIEFSLDVLYVCGQNADKAG